MRINFVSLIIGRRNAGKTFYALRLIDDYRKSHPYQKILVIDTMNHPKYQHLAVISEEYLMRWSSGGTYRIFTRDTKRILSVIQKNISNALIIFEDASKYIRSELSEDLRNYVIDTKQINVDLVFIFHGFGYVPAELWRIIDSATIMKCDNPKNRRYNIVCYEEVETAWKQVMESKEAYPKKTIFF